MTEHDEQVVLIRWFRIAYPKLIMFAIPNGEFRHIGTAIRLKKSGVVAGVSDLFLMKPNKHFSGLFIEMKAKGGKVSPQQKYFIEQAIANGYAAYVCFGFEDAQSVIVQYLKDI